MCLSAGEPIRRLHYNPVQKQMDLILPHSSRTRRPGVRKDCLRQNGGHLRTVGFQKHLAKNYRSSLRAMGQRLPRRAIRGAIVAFPSPPTRVWLAESRRQDRLEVDAGFHP